MTITTLIAILLLILLWFLLRRKSSTHTNDKLAKFWERPKYATKWDIEIKYPKSKFLQEKSIERKRKEAIEKERLESERKKQIIERHIKAARKEVQNKHEPLSKAELKLLSSLFYDYPKTCQLIEAVQSNYPEESRQWCAEVVLSELEANTERK
ncbi:hypothetical protein HCU40_11515 [Pseudanabaena biceps]|nr:hypothetical protein [Pseudanabaena biceps]